MTKRRFRPAGSATAGCTYYTCDYTNAPLEGPGNCHMPRLNGRGKWQKTGHYLNWECAVAHLVDRQDHSAVDLGMGTMTREQYLDYLHSAIDDWPAEQKQALPKDHPVLLLQRIEMLAGRRLQLAPSWSELKLFKGDMTLHDYVDVVQTRNDKVTGVVIAQNARHQDEVREYMLWPNDEGRHFDAAMRLHSTPFGTRWFVPMARPSRRVRGETAFAGFYVFYQDVDNKLPLNQLASNLFNTKLYGNVFVFAFNHENDFINTTKADFLRVHGMTQRRKRHRSTDCAMSVAEYKEAFVKMQEEVTDHHCAITSNPDIQAVKRIRINPNLSVEAAT